MRPSRASAAEVRSAAAVLADAPLAGAAAGAGRAHPRVGLRLRDAAAWPAFFYLAHDGRLLFPAGSSAANVLPGPKSTSFGLEQMLVGGRVDASGSTTRRFAC